MKSDLARRAGTAAVLILAAGAALYAGGLAIGLLALAAVAALHWEWTGLTLPDARDRDRLALTAAAASLAGLIAHRLTPAGIGLDPAAGPDVALAGAAIGFAGWAALRMRLKTTPPGPKS